MTTVRRPVRPALKRRFPPEAIAAFKRMEKLRNKCTCPTDWEGDYWDEPDPCAACDAWWDAHLVLHRALHLSPMQYPAFAYPDDANPYPVGSHAATHWQRERDAHPERLALYAALVEAALDRRKVTALAPR